METLDKDFTASSCSVKTFFNEKLLSIPAYQREYVWRPKNVLALLSDLQSNFDNAQLPMYIGSVICIQKKSYHFEIIDGQQRSVTLFAILAAGVKILQSKSERSKTVQKFESLIQFEGSDLEIEGLDQSRPFIPSINLQYDTQNSRKVIERLSSVVDFEFETTANTGNIRGKQSSHLRIEHAANLAYSFLIENYDNVDQLKDFLQFLIDKVYLVMIVARDESVAMNVFESANGRGVGLDSLDLVKNWLFMSAEKSAFDAIGQHWQQMKKSIEGADEKPARFLRTYCMSQLALDDYPSDKGDHGIYSWIKINGDRILAGRKPKELVSDISDAANMYKKLKSNEEFTDGKRLVGISNIALWSPSYRLHFVPMLSARHMTTELRQKIASVFERYVFVRSVSKIRHGSANEKLWAGFAKELRDITNIESLREWELTSVQPNLLYLEEDFVEGFKSLTYPNRKKFNYAVRKLYEYAQEQAAKSWTSAWNADLTLDHMVPCGSAAVRKDPLHVLNQIGNIALWAETDNCGSQDNLPLDEKIPRLAQSDFVLNKILMPLQDQGYGRATLFHQKLEQIGFIPFSKDEDGIQHRTNCLAKLAWECWSSPSVASL